MSKAIETCKIFRNKKIVNINGQKGEILNAIGVANIQTNIGLGHMWNCTLIVNVCRGLIQNDIKSLVFWKTSFSYLGILVISVVLES